MKVKRKAKRAKPLEMARIVVDPQDRRMDKFLPRDIAKELYRKGKLAFDLTNKCYAEVDIIPSPFFTRW